MKFSIRDLLLVTVIAAILTAWAIDHWRQAATIERLSEPYMEPARQVVDETVPSG